MEHHDLASQMDVDLAELEGGRGVPTTGITDGTALCRAIAGTALVSALCLLSTRSGAVRGVQATSIRLRGWMGTVAFHHGGAVR